MIPACLATTALLSLLTAVPTWQAPIDPLAIERPYLEPTGPFSAGHRGVDLVARPGSPVLAAGPGRVAVAGRVAGRWVVSVEHPAGLAPLPAGIWRTTYDGVRPAVAVGTRVDTGDRLGTLAPGSHCTCLHWGLKSGRTYADPVRLLTRPVVLKPTSWTRSRSRMGLDERRSQPLD